jgi:hypothetical protein
MYSKLFLMCISNKYTWFETWTSACQICSCGGTFK